MIDVGKWLVGMAASCVAAGGLEGQVTWYVDGTASPGGNGSAAQPFVTIASGIMAASPADEVVVAPGTYMENLSYLGKDIVVRAAQGPFVTTINGGGSAPVVALTGGETIAAILEGFTVTGGQGAVGVAPGPFISGSWQGGGIWAAPGSSITVRFCIVTGNSGGGGGVGIGPPFGVPGGTGGAGGIDGAARVEWCLIEGNTGGNGGNGGATTFPAAGTLGGPGGAGGVASVLVLDRSIVRGNLGGTGGSAGLGGGGPGTSSQVGGRGGTGGVSGVSTVSSCRITANQGGGGGVPAGFGAWAAGGDGGLTGGAVLCVGTELSLNQPGLAAFAGAPGQNAAGGATVGNGSQLLNVTVGGNGALPLPVMNAVGGLRILGGSCILTNGIVWGNGGLALGGSTWIVSSSIVQGGYAGNAVQDVDPRWANLPLGDLHLKADSPARDVGDGAVVPQLPLFDLDGEPIVGNGLVDLGADEFFLRLQAPQAAPGAPTTLVNGNLLPGGEYFNLVSTPCAAGPASGPILGLCIPFSALLQQLLLPLGAAPFHFTAAAEVVLHGPYTVPPVVLEAVLFRWDGTRVDAVSPVTTIAIQ